MGKNKEQKPYFVDMNISIDGLQNAPKEIKSAEMFISVVIGSIITVGKQKTPHGTIKGLPMPDQRRLYRVRNDLANASKTEESHRAKVEYEDFRFVMKCWNEHNPDPQGNELVMRVDEKLQEAIKNHDMEEEK